MKVKGFGAWPSRNVFKGGQTNSFDEYNKTFKGAERFPRAEEYASRGVEEYHHYQEQQDLTVEQDDNNSKKNKKKDSKKSRQRMVQQFVALVAGSAMIASAYTVASAKRAQKQVNDADVSIVDTTPDNGEDATDYGETQPATDVTVLSEQKWEWSQDGKSATLIITDSSGNKIGEVEATVTTSEEPAGCKTEGKLTYTATAIWEGQEYSDSRDEVLPALGHSFDNGNEVTLEDGSPATDYECERCGEHFVIKNSITEE